jgi:flagellar motor switch/type III secretory pathway protein FliN
MARPSKYNWDEIANLVKSGMTRTAVQEMFGCSSGRLSEELTKRGIKEADPKLVRAKNAIVDAVRQVSEVSENNGEKNSVIAVAAHESGHRMILESIMDEANSLAVDIMREKRELGELSIMETKQVVEMTSKHIESRYGKITPDNQNNIAVQVNGMPAMMPTVIEIVAPE